MGCGASSVKPCRHLYCLQCCQLLPGDKFDIICNLCSEEFELTEDQILNVKFSIPDESLEKISFVDKLCKDHKTILSTSIKLNIQFTTENFLGLCDRLNKGPSLLTSVKFKLCQIDENSWKTIGNTLEKFSSIENLDFSKNIGMGDGLIIICKSLITSSNNVKDLNLSMCMLSENHWIEIGKILENFHRLKNVDLSGNRGIGDNGVLNICEGLKSSSTCLRYLNLSDCNFIFLAQWELICALVGQLYYLEIVDLSYNTIQENVLIPICKGLQSSFNSLISINFSFCNFSSLESKVLGNFLMDMPKLQKVNLSANKHMGVGLALICNGLVESSNTLTTLSFVDCELNNEQCLNIAYALKKCHKIAFLNLSFNTNMGDGLESICEGLLVAKDTLQSILCYKCFLTDSQKKVLLCLLVLCPSMLCLDMRNEGDINDGSIIIETMFLRLEFTEKIKKHQR
ncbi:unnamed protein product [Dimorphilus gyrociliatus]|uniref:Uncharacterized protein n=1 Tax=Dimorphilus gyrociliatus TaxID=2664684 RepID=A0A7I8WFG2_9ANNE|nr:unnamed protein product [Dimorphilus gyrociliatus]